MYLCLKDKNVFIAGSSRGIGKAIAASFVAEGANVVLSGRNEELLRKTIEELKKENNLQKIIGFSGDLGETKKLRSIYENIKKQIGGLDIVICNIGSGKAMQGFDLSDDEWNRMIHVNLMTSIRIAREAVPGMIRNKAGNIIFIASIAGLENLGAPIAYESSKAAIIAASKNLSSDLSQYNIRVNCVAPGNILFPGSTWDDKLKNDEKKTMSYINKNVPMKRFGTPDEIADVVVFLASERASFVTGSCVVVDGGQTRGFIT